MEKAELVALPSAFHNVHGVINLDAVVSLLSGLMQHVEQQNKVIADLQFTMKTFVKSNLFNEKVTQLDNLITRLDNRCDTIQRAATSHVHHKQ